MIEGDKPCLRQMQGPALNLQVNGRTQAGWKLELVFEQDSPLSFDYAWGPCW